VAVGTIGSVLGAQAVARNQAQQSRQRFVASARGIASTLTLALQHEQDLVLTVGTFVTLGPQVSQSTFQSWITSIHAFQRYPEVIGIADVALVHASGLGVFAAQSLADPAGPLGPGGTFQVSPAGNRPYYCLATAVASRTVSTVPAGFDFCDSQLGAALIKARDSGEAAYVPYETGKTAVLVLGTPLYAGGPVPTSLAARQARFIGWTGTSIEPGVILASALVGHPSTAVAFHYRDNGYSATFRAGAASANSQSTTINLQNGWSVEAIGAATGGSIFAGNALGLLLTGIAFFLLFAAVLSLLATSRSRALEMVRTRTAELRTSAAKLRSLAFHDSLTGLPNRALILDRVDTMLKRSRRDHTQTAALFLDLDNFKDINDTLGHEAGDELLVKVAGRLTSALRDGDSIGRLGGDEFVVLVDGSANNGGPEVVAQRVLDSLVAPISIASSPQPLQVTASIGIAEGSDVTSNQLLKDADIALYQAKGAGKRRAVVFSPSMQESVDGHRLLDEDLRHALQKGEFFVLYQPTVDLASGIFTGVEALLRWNHPIRGVLEPDEFVPSLEASGLIVPVGQWVLEQACRQGALWQRQGLTATVAVNVSAVQLERDRIVDVVRAALERSGFDPTLLVLEITETAIMRDVQSTLVRLNLLTRLGPGIAVDDFGTGYSSLAYLRQFPIDVLKIDQSFVSCIAESSESAAIVHTLVQLGKVLGLQTVAEGIENDDQLLRLRSEGVDIGQGFLFARPMDAAGAGRLLGQLPTESATAGTPTDDRVDDGPGQMAERPTVGQRR
jgi:diguanylate cyclase (GGDEF)-like protein